MSVCLSQKPQTILLLVHLLFSCVCFICKACWISAFLPEPSWPPVDHRGITIMKGTADHSWSATWADVDNLSTKIEDGSTTPLRLNWLGLSPVQRLFKATLNLHQSQTHTHTVCFKTIQYFIFSLLKKISLLENIFSMLCWQALSSLQTLGSRNHSRVVWCWKVCAVERLQAGDPCDPRACKS